MQRSAVNACVDGIWQLCYNNCNAEHFLRACTAVEQVNFISSNMVRNVVSLKCIILFPAQGVVAYSSSKHFVHCNAFLLRGFSGSIMQGKLFENARECGKSIHKQDVGNV